MNDENNKKPLQFSILGLPSNEEIEVEDEKETPKQSYRREPKLPKEVQEAFDRLFGSDPSKNIENITHGRSISSAEKQMLEGFLKSMGFNVEEMMKELEDDSTDDSDEEDENDSNEKTSSNTKFVFELGKIEHLFQKEAFQQILIQTDPNLYIDFIQQYGAGPYSTTFFSSKNWACFSSCPIPLTRIHEYSIVDHNNKYILLYGTTQDKSEQGIFIAVTKGESGDYQLVIPEYGNTYELVNPEKDWDDNEMFEDNPNNCSLYSANTNPELFTNEGKFIFLDLDKIHAGLEWLLCQKEEPLVSPKKFGTLVQVRSSVDESSHTSALRIGALKSNDSSTAALLKRDFDVPEEKNVFDFYLKFSDSMDGVAANYLADYLSSVDISSTLLLDNRELKVRGRGDKLYINIDLDTIGSNLLRWINPRGNSEF